MQVSNTSHAKVYNVKAMQMKASLHKDGDNKRNPVKNK